jgi:hypothetical protein
MSLNFILGINNPGNSATFFGMDLFNQDLIPLVIRMLVNLAVLTIVVRFLYYQRAKRKDYLFTFYLIGMITFFLCFGLKKLDIDTGMGLGLFAIFGILRYRTEGIEIKEMTYLFMVIGLSVINALSSKQLSLSEMLLMNLILIVMTVLIEFVFLLKHETRKVITYERIDLITPAKHDEMKADLEARTGLKINRFEIGKIDFLRDCAQVKIFYHGSEQSFGNEMTDGNPSVD